MRKKNVFLMGFSFILLMSFTLSGCSFGTSKDTVKGNLIMQSKSDDFKKGKFEGTEINSKGTGTIQISKENESFKKNGVYTSETIYTEPFQNMLLSCNADTPEGTSVKVEVQVKVSGKWSKWLNWGTWGAYIKSGSNLSKQQDELAVMDEDVLMVNGEGKTASAIKYKLTLETSNPKATPSVKTVALSLKNNTKPIAKLYNDSGNGKDYANLNKVLDVPKFSQMIRDKNIAMNICSPTCISMVMNYYGINVLPEECAWGVYDNQALLFGNWAFNCAYAGSYDLQAYTDYFDSLDDIKREISNGYPVIASVRYKNSESVEGDLPVLHGAPIDKTEGHLVLVCGFKHENGKEYIVVNDPAAQDDAHVRVKYLPDEFEKAWFKVVYIIHKGEGDNIKPRRTDSEFVATGRTRQNMDDVEAEYQLKVNNNNINLSRDNIKTIMVSKDGTNYEYIYPNSSKNLWFKGKEGPGTYRFIIIAAGGRVYTSEININKKTKMEHLLAIVNKYLFE